MTIYDGFMMMTMTPHVILNINDNDVDDRWRQTNANDDLWRIYDDDDDTPRHFEY